MAFGLFLCLTAPAQSPSLDPFTPANAFAAAYNEWAQRLQARYTAIGPQGFDAGEQRAFHTMVDRFSELRKAMKLQYQ